MGAEIDWTDETLRTKASMRGEPLPVFSIERAVGDPVDNFYILLIRGGGQIYTQALDDGSYHVLVEPKDGPSRMYSDADTPHARNVFWTAMAMVHAMEERIAAMPRCTYCGERGHVPDQCSNRSRCEHGVYLDERPTGYPPCWQCEVAPFDGEHR